MAIGGCEVSYCFFKLSTKRIQSPILLCTQSEPHGEAVFTESIETLQGLFLYEKV